VQAVVHATLRRRRRGAHLRSSKVSGELLSSVMEALRRDDLCTTTMTLSDLSKRGRRTRLSPRRHSMLLS
jgi:hypothetical protein